MKNVNQQDSMSNTILYYAILFCLHILRENLNQIQRRTTTMCALLVTEKLTNLVKALPALTIVIAAAAIAGELVTRWLGKVLILA